MKIKIKQSFEIDGSEYRVFYKGKPETVDVPLYFIFMQLFVLLFKDEKIEILDVTQEELEALGKDEELQKRFSKVEPDAVIQETIEGIMMKKEPKQEGEDETDSDSSDVSDSGSQSEGSEESSEQSSADESQASGEDVQTSQSDDAEMKEYEALHEKAKRLNKNEKKRYEELKTKLGIEG